MGFKLLRIVPYRLRILLRAAFLLLALATLGLAVSVLLQEKQLSYKNYQASFRKTGEQIAATLRHPSGQLALLNPAQAGVQSPALRPLLLPFPALDFDDQQKVQQAVAMSGCLLQYGSSGSLCAGIGNNPWAGGFIYVAGSFDSARLVSHRSGDEILKQSHRLRVSVTMRGQTYRWIAPFEEQGGAQPSNNRYAPVRGRLTGFNAADEGRKHTRPVKDFRGWIWQNAHCNQAPGDEQTDACMRNAFFSLRLPVSVLQEALFDTRPPSWPPADLAQIQVSVAVLPPGDGAPLLDSEHGDASPAFSLADLKTLLLPGETLRIDKVTGSGAQPIANLTGAADANEAPWHLLTALIRRLPVDEFDQPLASTQRITTPLGPYDIVLQGDARSVSKSLSVVASRLAWFVGAMLAALLLAWLAIEIGIISRIKALIDRADAVARTVKAAGGPPQLDLSDLRGEDELGVLASCLHDLLRRVREDVEREGIRAEQERDMWHAVGHEIMSPLQSLMVLHGAPEDQSHRYITRMQQAIRVLYGSASPSEAFQSTVLQVGEIDIAAFLVNVAANAPCVGIDNVQFDGREQAVMVRADEYSLEDVVTHVLRNADRYRDAGSAIVMRLDAGESGAEISIFNSGPHIAAELVDRIFEYGVSDQQDAGAHGNRGQGLFVAKTYMAKMGGTITAHNRPGGVSFVLSLQRGQA
ncbi:MAG: sensor histidine kinase [Pseudomonadota bacterium]